MTAEPGSLLSVGRYRKKPVAVDALQFTDAHSLDLLVGWSKGAVSYSDGDGVHIDTLEGRLYVADGDWVIRGVQGEFYPCKPDIFEATYEASLPDAATRGLPPLDTEGILWVAAIDRVSIEERVEWVATMTARVEELNAMRESYMGDPPGAGWQE